jgi:DNA-directed RNA polymerase specialized sigma24 family protein
VPVGSSEDAPVVSSDDTSSASSEDDLDEDEFDDDAPDAVGNAAAPVGPRTRYAWSPETDPRPEVRALFAREPGLGLDPREVLLLRSVYGLVYKTYGATLQAVVRNCGANEHVQVDLMQEAYIKLFKSCIAHGPPRRLQAKLLWFGVGVTRNWVKRAALDPTNQRLPASSKQAPGSFPTAIRIVNVQDMLAPVFGQLSPEHQEAIQAVVIDDMTIAEAARVLGIKRRTLSSRLSAALARAEALLDELCPESVWDFE